MEGHTGHEVWPHGPHLRRACSRVCTDMRVSVCACAGSVLLFIIVFKFFNFSFFSLKNCHFCGLYQLSFDK